MGYVLREGGAEFGGGMRGPDLQAIALAGVFDAPIRIIPTAAAPDHNHARTGRNGTDWFTRLGARNVTSLVITDKRSAGAMVLCEWYFDPGAGREEKGLGLVPNALVLPHHNTFGRGWALRLQREAPGVTLIGIGERTGMLNDGHGSQWRVWGDGAVTPYRARAVESFLAGTAYYG